MKLTTKTLVDYLNTHHGADYTRAEFKRGQIRLFRPGEFVEEIDDATTPFALAQDMGFISGALIRGAFVVA